MSYRKKTHYKTFIETYRRKIDTTKTRELPKPIFSEMKKKRCTLRYHVFYASRWLICVLVSFAMGFYAALYITGERVSQRCFGREEGVAIINDVDFQNFLAKEVKIISDAVQDTAPQQAIMTLLRLLEILAPQFAVASRAEMLSSLTSESADACGEKYEGPKGPIYLEGFVPDPQCKPKDMPSLASLVTVLMLNQNAGFQLHEPLEPVRRFFPNLPAILTVVSKMDEEKNTETEVLMESESAFARPGALWNKMLARVRTPYVLVARGAVRVDELSRLPRLVYVLTAMRDGGVAVVGGAIRHASGRWRAGCLQTQLRHYALRLQRGYHHSAHDCMLCDHLEGPFLVRAELLREVPFHEELPAAVLFEDWFLRIKRRGAVAAVCPDALFFVSKEHREPRRTEELRGERREAWRQLALHWQLDSVLPPGRAPLRFSCAEVGLHCDLSKIHSQGLLMPTCCLQQMVEAFKIFDDFATKHGLDYELSEGTSLGAVKLRSIMPWDIDGDIFIRLADFLTYEAKQSEMSELGCPFSDFTVTEDSKFFIFNTPDITVDMWCLRDLSTVALPKEMQNVPTRVEINGLWLRGYWNPGLAARNRYGPGYLQHALHWRKQGMSTHFDQYKVANWGNCSFENHHSCLNKYPTGGSFDLLLEELYNGN